MKVNNVKELHTGLKENKDIELQSDIDCRYSLLEDYLPYYGNNIKWSQIKEYNGVLDGNGYELQNFIRRKNNLVFKLNGTIKNVCINLSFTSQCHVGKLCEVNDGEIRNCSITYKSNIKLEDICRRNNGLERTGGVICHYNNSLIKECTISNTEVSSLGCYGICESNYNKVGGICIVNDGIIQDCTVTECTFEGENHSSGICDENTGVIVDCQVYETELNSEKSVNGICRYNDGEISDCLIYDTKLNGGEYSNGIALDNEGKVTDCDITDSELTSESSASGISKNNTGEIICCEVSGTKYYSEFVIGLVFKNEGDIHESKINKNKLKAENRFFGVCKSNSGTLTNSVLSKSDFISNTDYETENGGLVESNYGDISNCIVQDISTKYKHSCILLARINNGTIEGCIVDSDHIVPDEFVGGAMKGEVESCIAVSEFDSNGFIDGVSTADSMDQAKTIAML